MKKIFLLPFYLSLVTAVAAQTDTSRIKIVEPPDSTAIGAPDGILVNKQIGLSGGTIISEDRKVELIFPEGALTENKIISIQPTINLAPNGAGKAYQFEPSGLQFKKPVKIIFHYTEEEAKECPADLMVLALQDHSGKWSFFEYDVIDTLNKTLAGELLHFSGGSNVKKLALYPMPSLVLVDDTTTIFLLDLTPKVKRKKGQTEIGYLETHKNKVQALRNFEVNNFPDGNELVGKVFYDSDEMHPDKQWLYNPIYSYQAPKLLPHKNPVVITAWVGVVDEFGDFIKLRRLACKVEIYDQYIITAIFHWDERFDIELIDSASFTATVYAKKVVVTNIKNYPPSVKRVGGLPYGAKGAKIVVDETTPGIINISQKDIGKPNMSNDQPPEIFFEVRSSPVTAFKFNWIPKKTPPKPVEPVVLDSMPNEINFIANGKHQVIKNESHHFQLVVDPVRDKKAP